MTQVIEFRLHIKIRWVPSILSLCVILVWCALLDSVYFRPILSFRVGIRYDFFHCNLIGWIYIFSLYSRYIFQNQNFLISWSSEFTNIMFQGRNFLIIGWIYPRPYSCNSQSYLKMTPTKLTWLSRNIFVINLYTVFFKLVRFWFCLIYQ